MSRRSRRSQRPSPGTYRPPRDRREVAMAVACALAVLLVTATLLFVLRPRDESPPEVPISVPPATEPVPSVPLDTTPPETTAVPAP
jgi:hypothetical protein